MDFRQTYNNILVFRDNRFDGFAIQHFLAKSLIASLLANKLLKPVSVLGSIYVFPFKVSEINRFIVIPPLSLEAIAYNSEFSKRETLQILQSIVSKIIHFVNYRNQHYTN